jgi:CRP-like cAMP-binding protein
MASANRGSASNLLLDAIQAEGAADLGLHAKIVELERAAILFDTGDRIRYVYFPMDCVLSTLAILSNGSSLEVNVIGCEGVCGIIGGLGSAEAAARVAVLVGGKAVRVPMRHVRAAFEHSGRVRALILRHIENMLFQIQQSAVCAAQHSIEARLSRWLLAIHDHALGHSLRLTHEFVAGHLGANRTSVTLAAAALQRAGFIHYRRGVLSITDRPGLEETACECYGAIRDRLRRLFR